MRLQCLVLALALLTAPLARAETTEARFAMTILGVTAGHMDLSGRIENGRYSVTAQMRSTGLMRAVRSFAYRGASQGRFVQGQFRPERHEGRGSGGNRGSELEIAYRDGVPQILRYVSEREDGPDTPSPDSQRGTLDPLTTLFAVLRDVPGDALCGQQIAHFDGRRSSRIAMRPAPPEDGRRVCLGEYRRLQGYTPKELAERPRVAFRVEYSPRADGLWQVETLSFRSPYGPAALDRR